MLTREKLNKLHELTGKEKILSDRASEFLRTAQDRFNHVKHKVVRDGKKVEATEKDLWAEVWYLGQGCEAGKLLKEKHPEVFAAFADQNKAANELKAFCIKELNVDFAKLTISDYLMLSEELFKLLIAEDKGQPAFTMDVEKKEGEAEPEPVA